MKPRHVHLTEDCRAVSDILQRVGDKWTVLVVGKLGDGPMRFNELRTAVGGISQKMLTADAARAGARRFRHPHRFPTIPPRVDYELTDLGRELLEPVHALGEWARKNTDRVNGAARFDAAVRAASQAVSARR